MSGKTWAIIIGILIILLVACVGVLFLGGRIHGGHYERARRGYCEAMIGQLEQALSMYRMDHDEYPSPDAGGLALLSQPGQRHGAYFEFKPGQRDASGRILDPWGRPYIYRLKSDARYQVILYSLGPNGIEEGGAGDDINNWD